MREALSRKYLIKQILLSSAKVPPAFRKTLNFDN